MWQLILLCKALLRLKAYYLFCPWFLPFVYGYYWAYDMRKKNQWSAECLSGMDNALGITVLLPKDLVNFKLWYILNFFLFKILTRSLLSENNWVAWISPSNRIHWCMQHKEWDFCSRSNVFGVLVGWFIEGDRYKKYYLISSLRNCPYQERKEIWSILLNACEWFHDLFPPIVSRSLIPIVGDSTFLYCHFKLESEWH